MTYWVKILLIANIVMHFFIRALNDGQQQEVLRNLVVIPGLWFRTPWTLITHQFVHGGFYHILFNMWALYILGGPVENRLGSRHFITLYLVSGVAGAILSLILFPMAPFSGLLGASGAIFGIAVAFARFWPDVRFLLMFIIPVTARGMITVAWVASIVLGVLRIPPGIGHFAHLGGLIGAYAYLRWLAYRSPAEAFKRKAYEHVKPSMKTDSSLLSRIQAVDLNRLHALNREEFVRLQQKIESDGIRGLTLDDRAFLDRFS